LSKILKGMNINLRVGCNGNGTCGLCSVRISGKDLKGPTENEIANLTDNKLKNGFRLACQIIPRGDIEVEMQDRSEQDGWLFFRDGPMARRMERYASEKDIEKDAFGIAVDVGTTNIQISLVNMLYGARVAGIQKVNPQSAHGADVITRLVYSSQNQESADALRNVIIFSLKKGIDILLKKVPLVPEQVIQIRIVGNTAMLLILASENPRMLLDPDNWMKKSESVEWNIGKVRSALGLVPGTDLKITAPLAGFIGSDVTADIISSGVMSNPGPNLLIDFGTNTELALWNGKELFLTAASGGPALEAVGISCGIGAEDGAIYHAALSGEGGFQLKVLGCQTPNGVCGSGLIDIVAELLRNGLLDERGNFTDGVTSYPIAPEGGLSLDKGDIDNIMKAKAAVATGIQVLLGKAEQRADELKKIYITGCFGKHLDTGNAIRIGLLPNVPSNVFSVLDRGALVGCEKMIAFKESADMAEHVSKISTLINLAKVEEFESVFMNNLYIRQMRDEIPNSNIIGLKEYIKATQYILSVNSLKPEIELSKAVLTFLRADIAGMGYRNAEGQLIIEQWSKTSNTGMKDLRKEVVENACVDVLDSGFLMNLDIVEDKTNLLVLPVDIERQTTYVLIVGYSKDVHLDAESLNIHLAVASQIGTIIQRLKNEEELRRHRSELSTLVEEKTEELKRSYKELKLTKDAIQMANRKLNILGSITRHDIMNQLTVVKGYLGLISADITDPKALDRVAKIELAADRVLSLIQFTKDYEEMGVKEPVYQVLLSVVREATNEARSEIVIADDSLKEYEVFADPMLVKVFYNLLDNSARHGGKVSRIRVAAHEEPDGLQVTYEDDGVGIDEATKKQLFQKGFGKNTGLGLFLIREILGITGISIIENGIPGKGARFEILVPPDKYRRSITRKS